MMPMRPGVSVILVHYGDPEQPYTVLRLFRDGGFKEMLEVIVVDNGGHTRLDPQKEFAGAILVTPENNTGYAAACNLGAGAASCRHLLFLNNDIMFDGDFIGPLLQACEEDRSIGLAGPRLSWQDGSFQPSWIDFPGILSEFRERRIRRQARRRKGGAWMKRSRESERSRDVDSLAGAAMFFTREAFDAVGGFDAGYSFYFEDVDICRRLHSSGYRVRYVPESRLTHFGGGSQDGGNPVIARAYREGQLRYYARHKSEISFQLIKLYLLLKFVLMRRPEPESSSIAQILMQTAKAARRRELRGGI